MNHLFKKSLIGIFFSFIFIIISFSILTSQAEAATVSAKADGVNPLTISGSKNVRLTADIDFASSECRLYKGADLTTPVETKTASYSAGSIVTFTDQTVTATTTYTVKCDTAPVPVNGVCNNSTRNSCYAGTSNDGAIADDTNYYKWRCDGIDGGTNSGTCQINKYTVTYFEWGGSTDVVNPKSYSLNPTTGLPYSICDEQSGPFTHYFNLATSSTATYPGVQVYVNGTVISNPIANYANVQAAGHFPVGQGLKWLRKNGYNTIWEVNPTTGVLSSGSLSCP